MSKPANEPSFKVSFRNTVQLFGSFFDLDAPGFSIGGGWGGGGVLVSGGGGRGMSLEDFEPNGKSVDISSTGWSGLE